IMETEANDPNHLVNYDNDNDIDDLGYESEVYLDEEEEEEEEENYHLNRNVVKRGITRLSKFRKEYGKSDGIKINVTFDALNRISGKHRALFSSFLGDLRYSDVDLTVKKLVMNRLGQLLRNFRRKLRQTYILPNQNRLSKLNEVPVKYSVILKDKEWVNFVKYMTTEEYKVKSAATKLARSKSVYQHTMGRGGYAHVKKKMIKNKEIEPDEEPPRGILWLKGRVNKDGEFPNDEIRLVGDKLVSKEKGGYARGVGSGVTYKRYFDLPRSRQASDERIVLLQSQLDNERRERQEKELEIQNLSNKMSSQQREWYTKLKSVAAQGGISTSSAALTSLSSLNHEQYKYSLGVSPVDINLINSSADEEGGTTVVRCENDANIQKSNGLATLEKEMETRINTEGLRKDSSRQDSQSQENVSPLLVLPQAIKCKLWHLNKSTIIALGTVYKTDGKQMLHNKQLLKDCYKVSIDTSLVDAACIPDVGNNGFKTVKDAVGGFFAWPKDQVVFDPKATPPSTIQMNVENKTAPKLHTKRKNVYVSSDAMQRQI
ncbi:transposase, Ptta/En/Spm, transposase, Tnp1/En/Spm-like protein, partial [Tanacetum coccineum]